MVLDAGHGKPDEGAEGENGITEEKTNLDITLKVQKLLEESGATVILTRSDENGIYDIDKNTLREMKVSDIKEKMENQNSYSVLRSRLENKHILSTSEWGKARVDLPEFKEFVNLWG